MIKKGLLIAIFLLMLLVPVMADSVLVEVDGFTNVRIESLRMDPATVGAGENFDLYLSIETERKSSTSTMNTLDDVEIELVEGVFTLQSGEDAVKELGSMLQGQQTTVKYSLKADNDAVEGENGLQFIISVSGKEIESPDLMIDVSIVDSTLSVYEIVTEPETLEPGQIAELQIKIKNGASADFRNVHATLESSSLSPIVPYMMTNELKLSSLEAGDSYTFEYNVVVEEDAAAGVYKVPFVLEYEDNDGNTYSKNETFGVLVSADADLTYNLEEFDTFQAGTKGKVVASVSNTGSSELKFVTLKLLESDDYVVLGSAQEYLGNVDSDDFETSSYEIYVSEEDVELMFEIEYKDAYNNEYSEEFSLDLPIYTKNEIKMYGLDGNTGTFLNLIIYAILILLVYFVIRGWRREKAFDRGCKEGFLDLIKLPFRILFFFRPSNLAKLPKKIGDFFRSI
jgi:hypothetical protein